MLGFILFTYKELNVHPDNAVIFILYRKCKTLK